MTARDRMIVIVLLVVGALGGFWLGVLGPKRREAKDLDTRVAAAQSRLEQANASASQAEAAKARYREDYTAVVRLGKAVPVDESTASLVYQLELAAQKAKMDLRSVKLTAPNPAATSAGGQDATASSGNANANANANSGANAGANSDSNASANSGANTNPSAQTPPATSSSSSGESATTAGAAGFGAVPFNFVVSGGFFDTERLLDALKTFVSVHGNQVRVRGRLLTINGFSLQASPRGFPHMQVNVSATAYLLPPNEGLTPGATAQGPTPNGQGAASGSSAAPPTATVTGIGR